MAARAGDVAEESARRDPSRAGDGSSAVTRSALSWELAPTGSWWDAVCAEGEEGSA